MKVSMSNRIARRIIKRKINNCKKNGKTYCDFLYPLQVFEENKEWMQENGYSIKAYITCDESWCMSFYWRVSW